MIQILSELISALLQLFVFSLIPFIFFLFRKDKTVTFLKYIGLIKPTKKSLKYVVGVALLFVIAGLGLTFINESWKNAVLLPNSVTGKIRLMGFSTKTIIVILIIAMIKTSLSEEIFFRGFLAKQLINKFGFKVGNVSQATIFGSVHLLLFGFLTKISFLPISMIFIFTTLAGWTIGYIKEKYANNSIVPGWVAHGLGNLISYTTIAFFI
jgi:uncharacterized protein